jgi:trimethylamine-N-oxide reductase cytochrome c-type subunit TorC
MKTAIKKIATSLFLVVGALNLSAAPIYLIEDLTDEKVMIHSGVVLNKENKISTLNGFRQKGSTEIYATKNLSLEIAKVKDESIVKVSRDGDIQEVTLSLNIAEDKFSDDYLDAWDEKEEIFLEKCSQCHAAPNVGHHSMLEWEGLYGSMKDFAQPTPEEEVIILRYLKTFALDGIIKLEE